MTLRVTELIFPQSCSHPNSLELLVLGHRAGREQLPRGVAGIPEPGLPSGRAEADGAYGAFSDLPQQAHGSSRLGSARPFPALDDGGSRCACTLVLIPTFMRHRSLREGTGGPQVEEVGEEWGWGLAAPGVSWTRARCPEVL